MSKQRITTPSPRSLSAEEAERLFAKVDNSGHTDKGSAERQRERRKQTGHGVDVDPLSPDDPSGSNVGRRISRSAVIIVLVFLGTIVFTQVYVGARRAGNTANLSNNVSVSTVAEAMSDGIEWGGGFTQFPQEFSVQEADENTGRIEVSVTDDISSGPLECLSNSQIQATAFSVNSLLNPRIDTVIYHVSVYMNEKGDFQLSSPFGFFKPTGNLTPFITYVWTKSTTRNGQVRFGCTVSGVDDELQELLREQITSRATPLFGGGHNEDQKAEEPRDSYVVENRGSASSSSASSDSASSSSASSGIASSKAR